MMLLPGGRAPAVSAIATTLLLVSAQARAAAEGLPLRQDSVIGFDDILRIVFSLVVLLGLTAGLLWLYRKRFGTLPPGFTVREREIDVIARVRLSPRTQVFVLRRGTQELLVTESSQGATVTPLSAPAVATDSTGNASQAENRP